MSNKKELTLDQIERKAKKIKKQNNYHITKPAVCLNCKNNTAMAYYSSNECRLLNTDRYAVGGINDLGTCDKHEFRE